MVTSVVFIPVMESPTSDLLSLITDHSSYMSSVVGVGSKKDDLEDKGLCKSSAGLHIELPTAEILSIDVVGCFNCKQLPVLNPSRQPVPTELWSLVPLQVTSESSVFGWTEARHDSDVVLAFLQSLSVSLHSVISSDLLIAYT
jgi:hypothetical protein